MEAPQYQPDRSWVRRLGPGLLLGLLLALTFRGALAGRLFYLRDVAQNHYPIRHFIVERLLSGALPLWDPFHGGGTPLLANPNALVLHPISALFLILPFDLAFTASIVLQFVLLAWGGYLLARALPVGPEPAILGALVLALSGPMVSLASQQNALSGAAWVPLGLWLTLRGLEPGRSRLLAPAALCLAVVLIAAEPASLIGFVLLAGVLALTAPDAPRPGRRLVSLAGLGAVAVMIAAAQLLPARELLSLAARSAGFSPEEGMKWSLEPTRLLEMVFPGLFGDPTRLSPQAWWGRFRFEGGYPFLLTIYVGAIPVLLAVLAMARRGSDGLRRAGLAGIGLLGFLLAFGSHSVVYRGLFGAFGAVRQIRYPERFLQIALLPLALLAALGLERQLRGDKALRRRGLRVAIGAAAGAFIVVSVVASGPGLVDPLLRRVASVPPAILNAETGAVLRGSLLRSSLWLFGETAALAIALAAALYAPLHFQRRAAGWAIAAWSGLSLSCAAQSALSTAAPGWLHAISPLATIVGSGPGAPRLHHAPRPEGLSVWATTDELAWGYRYDRFTYALGSGHRDHVPTILDAATDRMDLAPQAALGRALPGRPLADRIRILSACGAGFLIAYEPLEQRDLESLPILEGFSLPPTRFYRLRASLPRARVVGASMAPSHPDDLAASLADPGFDPARAVLLERSPGAGGPSVPDDASPAGAPASVVDETPERVRVHCDAPRGGYLVLADAYAPGWRATVDGRSAPILRANGLFRAVAVAPGSHDVIMTYAPAAVRAGILISLLGLALSAVYWVIASRPRP